jgi:hypothetical protein
LDWKRSRSACAEALGAEEVSRTNHKPPRRIEYSSRRHGNNGGLDWVRGEGCNIAKKMTSRAERRIGKVIAERLKRYAEQLERGER